MHKEMKMLADGTFSCQTKGKLPQNRVFPWDSVFFPKAL